jgi:hypothetical protein
VLCGVRDELDRVGKALGRGQPATASHRAAEHEQPDEDQVDEGWRGLEEVVVVGGDELAQLVDEEPEADATDDRRRAARRAAHERKQDPDRDHHEHAAVQQVGDVEPVAAELRVVRQPQLGPDDEDRRHTGDEEGLLQLAEVRVAGRAPREVGADAHRASLPRVADRSRTDRRRSCQRTVSATSA